MMRIEQSVERYVRRLGKADRQDPPRATEPALGGADEKPMKGLLLAEAVEEVV